MNIPSDYILYDIRNVKDFKKITISGYKKRDVVTTYQNCIINDKLEDSVRWCTELHCTGMNAEILDTIYSVYIKYIHMNNPKLFFYIFKRMKDYDRIMCNTIKNKFILTKNNQELRNFFAELTTICVLSKKSNLFLDKSLPKISYKSYQKEEIHKRMISTNLDKIIEFVHTNTNNEIKLALNEIINNLESKKGTYQNCIYWYLWIEKLAYYHKKDSIIVEPLKIQEESFRKNDVEKDHWVNIIWNVILYFKIEKRNYKYIQKLHLLYMKDLKKSQIAKKKYHIFIAFYIIKNDIKWSKKLFNQEHLIIQTNININKIYRIIISNFEKSLTEENKRKIRKNYNRLLNEEFTIKKIDNINLNEDINKILSTKYPDFIDLRPTDNKIKNNDNNNNDDNDNGNDYDDNNDDDNDDNDENYNKKEDELISKNMNMGDIISCKEQLINKKLDAFKQFVSYKNKSPLSVIDYYKKINKNDIEEESIRNIVLLKRK